MSELSEWLANLPAEERAETMRMMGTDERRQTAASRTRNQWEHEHQKALIEWANYTAVEIPELARLYAVPNGGQRHAAVAAKMKAEGVKPGVFDLALDVARGGWHGLKLEMKHGDNTLTDNQRDWQDFYYQQGYLAPVAYHWQHAAMWVYNYLLGHIVRGDAPGEFRRDGWVDPFNGKTGLE